MIRAPITMGLSFENFEISPEDWSDNLEKMVFHLGSVSHSEDAVIDFIIKRNNLKYSLADPNNFKKMKKKTNCIESAGRDLE